MKASNRSPVQRLVGKLAQTAYGVEVAEGELLQRFVAQGDDQAFAALVGRHGPMVLRLCLRILHNRQDAEDAFQATFLVLVKKAAALRAEGSLAAWLHCVAYRAAHKARIAAARRRKHECCCTEAKVHDPPADLTLREAHAVLHQELLRLPEKLRLPLVLCYLEGLTRDEAACRLGWSASLVKSRLEQGRDRLRSRLARRGLALSGTLVALLFEETAVGAAVPTILVTSTTSAATAAAAWGTAAVPARVCAIAERTLQGMFVARMKSLFAMFVIAALLFAPAAVATVAALRADDLDGAAPAAQAAERRAPLSVEKLQDKDKQTVTAWGKEIRGLQAGLGFRPGAPRAYHYDDTVTLVVRLRNVGKDTVKFSYLQPFIQYPPTVSDRDGKPIPQPAVIRELGEYIPGERELAPGKEIELGELKRQLRPASESGSKKFMQPLALYGTGKVAVQYHHVLGPNEARERNWKLDSDLRKLATGKLELEIQQESGRPQPPPLENPAVVEAIKAEGGEVSFFKDGQRRWTMVNFAADKGSDASLIQLKGLKHLQTLNLLCGPAAAGFRQLTDAGLAHLKDINTVRTVNFALVGMTDAGLAHLKGCKNLEKVNLIDVPITGTGLEHLKGLPLKLLWISTGPAVSRHFSDAGLAHVKGFAKLEDLSLHSPAITDAGLEHLKGMVQLRSLTLGSGGLSVNGGISDAGLLHLRPLAKGRLESLDLLCPAVSDAGLEHLKDMTQLKSLNLSSAAVTNDGLLIVRRLTKLTGLNLSATRVTDAGLVHLQSQSGGLAWLDLQKTNISDTGLAQLSGFRKLRHLNVADTAVSDAGVETLQKALPELKIQR